MTHKLISHIAVFCLSAIAALAADLYHKDWIDFNKNGQKDVYEDSKADIDARIDDLLSQMTIEEKTGQMVTLYGWGRVLKDEYPTEAWKESSWRHGVANIDEQGNFPHGGKHTEAADHVEFIRTHQRWFVEETRLGIPVDFTVEGIRGVCHDYASSFPNQLGRGATFNRELEYEIGKVTALEAKALGYSNVYSPILDVLQDPRWGRCREVYGESPYLVGELGLEHVRALQDHGIVSTPKHYAIYSAPYGGKDTVRGDVQAPFRTVHEVYLEPFRKAFEEGNALGVMSTYAIYDGDSVSGSKYFLTDLLRDTYGFKGYVVSDSAAIWFQHTRHNQTQTAKESIVRSVNAGLNVRTNFQTPDRYLDPLREAIAEGLISEETINEMVRDVLYVKFWMGLFDNPYIGLDDAPERIRTVEARGLALQAARESVVLMRNRDSILPLDPKQYKKILVTGPSADSARLMQEHYGPHRSEIVTPLQGIREAFGDSSQVEYVRGCDYFGDGFPDSDLLRNYQPSAEELAEIEEAVAVAQDNDLIIACMGDSRQMVGEARSRTALTLPRLQEVYLQKLVETGKPVVLVLLNGRPIVLNDAQDGIPAVLTTFFAGEAAGTALADCLTGKYNPGGRLPYTTPKTVGQLPLAIPYRQDSWRDGGRVYTDGPLFPFGYGLSYTTFEYDDLEIVMEGRGEAAEIAVSFSIKNSGDRAGDVVPQLYIKDTYASVSPFKKQLRGFERVHLKAGEEKRVTLTLNAGRDLKIMNLDYEWVVEPGQFEFIIANSYSDDDTELSDFVTLNDDGSWELSAIESLDIAELVGEAPFKAGYPPKHVLDADPKSRWLTEEKDPTLTFLCRGEFNQIGFLWYNGAAWTYPFEVFVSDDLENWTEIYRGDGGETQFADMHDLPLVTSKYLRIQFHGNIHPRFGNVTSIYKVLFTDKTQL
jgi:beta-glucosidase